MDSIITYLLIYNQYLITIIGELLLFISQHIPLKQMIFDDSNSPEYQKFKVDRLPTILKFEKVDYKLLLAYYKHKYNKTLKPVQRRNGKSIPKKTKCPKCGAPHEYIYDNNGNKGQFKCKVCQLTFKEANYATKPLVFICPYCGATLTEQKQRKQFKMDLYPISKHATGFSFKKFNPHIMGLCLTYHVNCKMSTRQTAHVLEEVHGIKISHRTVANYALTAAAVIKPFVDTFNYKPSKILSADETYIKVKGIKHYVWIVMDACKKSILGYQVSDTRATGPCILAMRMAFDKFKKFPGKALNFVADGYSAYPLAKQQFELEENKEFNLTQVIGLTNEDLVSEEFRWVKQVVERLNRTFKSSYRVTCGYGSDEGALYGFSLWVAYYNFLRPHPYNYHRPLNELDALNIADNMPAKWQILINLGQQTILNMQESKTS